MQGLQTLTMANAAAAAQPGATILQYAQTSDGQQILVPSNQVVVQGERFGIIALISECMLGIWPFGPDFCQSAPPVCVSSCADKCLIYDVRLQSSSCFRRRSGLPDPNRPCKHHRLRCGHGFISCTTNPRCYRGGDSQTGSSPHEEQVHGWLILNSKVPNPLRAKIWTVRRLLCREAARECRRKKKEYVKCLENRVAVLENQNKTLIEELKALKDLYCHKSE